MNDALNSKGRYETLLDISPDAIVQTGVDGKILFCNQQTARIFGFDHPQEIIGLDSMQFVAPADADIAERNARILLAEGSIQNVRYRMQRRDGTQLPVEVNARLVRDESGAPHSFIGIVRDISERVKAEETLRESEALFREMAENIREVFWLFDWQEQRVVYVSPAYYDVWGRSPDDLVQEYSDWGDSLHPEDREDAEAAFVRSVETGDAARREYRIVRPDGTVRWIWDRAFAIRDGSGQVRRVAGIAEDVTERKKMEDELRRTHKLESVGILAGGIAHDFNNLLTAILGNINLAQMHLSPDHRAHGRLADAERASMRASELTQQLLTFSRGGTPVRKTVSLEDVIGESARFVLRGSNVRCEVDIAPDLMPADVDEGQISQVIHNLALNANQAMPEGGVLEIRAVNVKVDRHSGLPLPSGEYVRVEVEDHGTGIPPDHLQKIFDPYFSTKACGRGLGLAITYSVIKKHDGYITASSRLGVGTTFTFYLPAAAQPIVEKQPAEATTASGTGRVLIMDDEPSVADVAGKLLSNSGYDVAIAKNGHDVIKTFCDARASARPFDVVIMDLTIPGGMGGKEVIKRLLEIDPGAKAIVSSGYSHDPVMADFRQYGFASVLTKPYKTTELLTVVDRVIRGAR